MAGRRRLGMGLRRRKLASRRQNRQRGIARDRARRGARQDPEASHPATEWRETRAQPGPRGRAGRSERQIPLPSNGASANRVGDSATPRGSVRRSPAMAHGHRPTSPWLRRRGTRRRCSKESRANLLDDLASPGGRSLAAAPAAARQRAQDAHRRLGSAPWQKKLVTPRWVSPARQPERRKRS